MTMKKNRLECYVYGRRLKMIATMKLFSQHPKANMTTQATHLMPTQIKKWTMTILMKKDNINQFTGKDDTYKMVSRLCKFASETKKRKYNYSSSRCKATI
ncbi:hypothetical protein QE152_g27849 [Popillia japonica]|uniref:Uncharacterized protein n=1 Tax=Popillia japonica TaxID=7064 RepID=A0AAW1JN59_POPJA